MPNANTFRQRLQPNLGRSLGTTVSSDLNCAVNANGDTDGEWFGNTACGTFVAVDGNLFCPSEVPAGGGAIDAAGYVAWTPVSQTAMSGTASIADPFTVTTVVTGGSAVQVTQVDSYIVGQESYVTTDTVLRPPLDVL